LPLATNHLPLCFKPLYFKPLALPLQQMYTGVAARQLALDRDLFQSGVASLTDSAISKNGVPIRLTDERWAHISEEHGEIAAVRAEVLYAVEHPERIYPGQAGELLAARESGDGKWLIAVNRELGDDGFVITAFLTRRMTALERRKRLWP
jgi:hypothetical protein